MKNRARGLLPVLLLVSGFCGISYEILYTKLLGNLLGNHFTISASVLLTFLLGIGLGTLYAHRFVRSLWVIEAGIGLYAAWMVLSYGWIEALLYSRIPVLGTSVVACATVSIVLLVVPAFLVGCSVPLFAAYLSTIRSTHVFSMTYGIYNFGAALTALTLEFAVLRVFGLRAATFSLAMLNAAVAVALLFLVRTAPVVPAPVSKRLRFAPRTFVALALASVASAMFQLLMIKVAEFILGPYNETFSLVLAVVLLGLAFGSIAAGRFGLSFNGALILALGGVALLLLSISAVVGVYASLYLTAVKTYFFLVMLKLALVTVLMGLPALGFGATVPALLRTHLDVARESGQLLFVSSVANAAGFFLLAFVLHRHLDYGPMLVVIALLAAAGLVTYSGLRRRAALVGGVLVLVVVIAHQAIWNEQLLYFGHTEFHSSKRLREARQRGFSADRFKGHRDVFAIIHRGDRSYFFINGYVSIPLSSASEKIVGALSSMFAPRTDQALVFGVGSGATASSVGLIFDRVDAVEINAVILRNLHRMSEYNFDIENMESVNIVHDDGIHFVKTTPKRYSLILNTVTTPLYFSSSKLYTRDFLDAVVEKLTPDGVYTTWIDRKIGDYGIDIILETLGETFDNCWLTYLKSSYYLLVCSNGEIAPHQLDAVTSTAALRDTLAENHVVPIDLLQYSVISTDAFKFKSREAAPVNTLDFPVLEHEMARLDSESRLFGFKRRLLYRLDLKELGSAMSEVGWNPAEFALWADLRLSSSTTLGQALDTVIPSQLGKFTREYAEAAEATAAAMGTKEAYYKLGTRLYQRDDYTSAIKLFDKAIEFDPTARRAHYYKGRCYEYLGDVGRAEQLYRRVLEFDPGDERAREALENLSKSAPTNLDDAPGLEAENEDAEQDAG